MVALVVVGVATVACADGVRADVRLASRQSRRHDVVKSYAWHNNVKNAQSKKLSRRRKRAVLPEEESPRLSDLMIAI